MKIERSFFLLFMGVLIALMAVAMFPSPAAAQICDPKDPACQPAPAPGNPPSDDNEPSGKKRPTKTPTYVPRVPTKTSTPTEVPPFTPTKVPSFTPSKVPSTTPTPTVYISPTIPPSPYPYPGGGPGPGSYPYNSPPDNPTCIICPQTWLWWAGGGVIFLIALAGFLFLAFRGPRSLGSAGQSGGSGPFPGSDENATIMPPGDGLGNLPFMERGGNENLTVTTPDVGDLDGEGKLLPAIQRGVNESATMTVHDVGDISPDVTRSAREAASDPGGVQFGIKPPSPNTPGGAQPNIKPPNPNLGDKSGGGTL